MITKKEDLDNSKIIYDNYLKGRKKNKNESCFDSGFDFGYERGLLAAWVILKESKDIVIKKEEKNGGFFRKYHASFSLFKLMNLIMDYMDNYRCSKKYNPVECFCEKCGKLK